MKILLIIFFIFYGVFLRAATEEPNAAQKELVKKYQDAKDNFLKSESTSRKLMGSIYVLTERMKKVSNRRDRLTNKMINVKTNVKQYARDAAKLEKKISIQRQHLSQRLRAIYMLGDQGLMRVLFSSSSSHDLDRNLKFLSLISERDYKLIKGYEENLSKLTTRKARLKNEVRKLMGLKKNIEKNEKQIETDQKSKKKLLVTLNKEKKTLLKKLKGLRSTTKKNGLDQIIGGASFFEEKGHLKDPVDGPILLDYGLIESEEFDYRLSHKGLFFSAEEGDLVRGVYSGTVAYAGPIDGYGKTIIIDHGDHYYSVYSHTKDVKVSRGDEVERNQKIALVGPSPLGAGLYFEIRHFSDAINPRHWLENGDLKRGQL